MPRSPFGLKRRQPAQKLEEQRPTSEEEHLDRLLDEALKATFPASDPISITPAESEKPSNRSS
jgi:hypothetical protein